jgi:hypothetical protein
MLRFFLPAVVAAVLAGCQPPPPRQQLQPDELKQQWRTLASIAAEGGMLARQLAEGRVGSAYAWVEQQGLSDDAVEAGAQLAKPAPATLAAEQAEAMRVAAGLELELGRIAGARHDAAALRAQADRLAAMSAQSWRMGEPR